MGSTLPLDVVIEEILTRSSLETVARSRAVCKRFNEATQTWSFGEKCRRIGNSTISGFLILFKGFFRDIFPVSEHSRNLSFGFLPLRPVTIEAVAKQGLVLCRFEANRWNHVPRFIVCKPATKQWRVIPKPKTRYSTERIAMTVLSSNPNELRYKIVRFSTSEHSFLCSKSRNYRIYRCEVFDSATWAWRLLPEDIRVPSQESVLFGEPVVSAAGFVYALTSDHKILAFDWETETCHVSASLPAPLSEGERKLTLLDCRGKLAASFMAKPDTFMEVWMSEGSSNARVWNMRSRVNIESLNKTCCVHYASVLAMASNDVVVLRTCSGIKFFRFGREDSLDNKVVKTVDYHETSKYDFFCIESDEQVVNPRFLKMKKTAQKRRRDLI